MKVVCSHDRQRSFTWWTFRIFLIFFCSGEGKGSPRRREGGGDFFNGKSQEGGFSGWVWGVYGGGGRGAGRVFAGNLWGGAKFFFWSGPKFPPSLVRAEVNG